jgi:hypothetical protein
MIVGRSLPYPLPSGIGAREQIAQRSAQLDRDPCLVTAPFPIGGQMAPLAPCRQIGRMIVAWVGILVTAREDDATHLPCGNVHDVGPGAMVALVVPPSTACTCIEPAAIGKHLDPGEMTPATALTNPASAFKADGVGELGPVDRIKETIVPVDGHYSSSQTRRLWAGPTVPSDRALSN